MGLSAPQTSEGPAKRIGAILPAVEFGGVSLSLSGGEADPLVESLPGPAGVRLNQST